MALVQKLSGKRALVTGAGTGIGSGIALEFASQGADVIIHYLHEEAQARAVMGSIRQLGRRCEMLQADLDDVAAAIELGTRAIELFGGVDLLVNNAGISLNKPFLEMKPEWFDKLIHVNFRAQYFLTQRIVQDMLPRGSGAVCNIASIHGLSGAPEHSLYAGTKGAIIACTRALSVELAHQGVRVNAIAPGWITVESYATAIPGFNEADAAKTASEKVPRARAGRKSDIAKLAAFLCSDDADFIVGQTIVSDGGTSSLMSLISDFRTRSTNTFGAGYLPNL